eukprot:TRINITY_DN5063_c0_g1_i1.p1 TRINITY_DN5063_c0_g1~~TRINITY_DN5063_c0_g1_i1.p1  ORF type:complete len:122 (-),score=23.76 TRINITY_DN5063_c0_g1_i1:213-578(-)
MGQLGTANHETIGRKWLESLGFGEKVVLLVEGHVQAKRYLTFKNPSYYEKLSEASKGTLEYQGGPMNSKEAELFEQSPLFDAILKLRTWDEKAKDTEAKVPGLDHYERIILAHLQSVNTSF